MKESEIQLVVFEFGIELNDVIAYLKHLFLDSFLFFLLIEKEDLLYLHVQTKW